MADAAPRLRAIMAAARTAPLPSSVRPRFFGGGRFSSSSWLADAEWDAFGGWGFSVPSVLIAFDGQAAEGSLSVVARPGCDGIERLVADALASPFRTARPGPQSAVPPPAASPDWQPTVETVLREIADGRYRKMVLARSSVAEASRPFAVGEALSRLADAYPQCFVFQYGEGEAAWLGASPELLCSVQEGTVRAASLAGSRPRGATVADDRRLEDELVASAKERAEHAVVSLAIAEALGPLCDSVTAPEVPSVMKVANIQHLYTPLSGRLLRGIDLLDVVAALHPTPAVGGWPRAEALDAIDRLEGMDRGWYAGPIGWLDFRGEGEFAVALRSALVSGSRARLYAGAGIVAGSDPGEEYAETEAKLRPVREALGIRANG